MEKLPNYNEDMANLLFNVGGACITVNERELRVQFIRGEGQNSNILYFDGEIEIGGSSGGSPIDAFLSLYDPIRTALKDKFNMELKGGELYERTIITS